MALEFYSLDESETHGLSLRATEFRFFQKTLKAWKSWAWLQMPSVNALKAGIIITCANAYDLLHL